MLGMTLTTFPSLVPAMSPHPPALGLEQMPAASQTHSLGYPPSLLTWESLSHSRLVSHVASPGRTGCWAQCPGPHLGVALGHRVGRIVQ